jgi:glycosyltransferase involved in cell wall biosynthesis
MSEPRISVCIVTFNRAARLKENLDHLLAEDEPRREIVVVDGGSKDGTVELLKSYGSKVRWLSERDRGEYDAWNKAFALAKGDIVKWLPDDDSLRHGACGIALAYLDAHPQVEVLWGQAQIWRELDSGERIKESVTQVLDLKRLSKRNVLRQLHGMNSVATFMRKSLVERLGPLRLDMTCGDTEFWVRAISKDARMAIVPDILVDYVITGENGVITKNWKLSRDVLRINLEYGAPRDVAWTLWHRRSSLLGVPTLQHEVGKVAQRIGFHPLRTLRKIRSRLRR